MKNVQSAYAPQQQVKAGAAEQPVPLANVTAVGSSQSVSELKPPPVAESGSVARSGRSVRQFFSSNKQYGGRLKEETGGKFEPVERRRRMFGMPADWVLLHSIQEPQAILTAGISR